MLFITGTNAQRPSADGAIMALGVSYGHVFLVVPFANDERCAHESKTL